MRNHRGEIVWGGMGLVYALGMGYARIERGYIECDLEEACEQMGVPLNAVVPSDTLGEAFERALTFKECQRMAEGNRRQRMFNYDVVFKYKMPGLPKDYAARAKLSVGSQVVGRSDHASLERAAKQYLRDEFEERGINFDADDYEVQLVQWLPCQPEWEEDGGAN